MLRSFGGERARKKAAFVVRGDSDMGPFIVMSGGSQAMLYYAILRGAHYTETGDRLAYIVWHASDEGNDETRDIKQVSHGRRSC